MLSWIVLAGAGWYYFARTGAEENAMAEATPVPSLL